jgi:hypothetical protein
MLGRALDAGVPAAWVTGDEVYGADPGLRAELERRGIGYVLAVACDDRVVAAGHSWCADALARRVPARAWQWVSAGTERVRRPSPSGLAPLTCNEVQHLLVTMLTRPAGELGHRLRWSVWRRRHQARARTCHYRGQANQP